MATPNLQALTLKDRYNHPVQRLTITLPETLLEDIKVMAKRDKSNVSKTIAQLLIDQMITLSNQNHESPA